MDEDAGGSKLEVDEGKSSCVLLSIQYPASSMSRIQTSPANPLAVCQIKNHLVNCTAQAMHCTGNALHMHPNTVSVRPVQRKGERDT